MVPNKDNPKKPLEASIKEREIEELLPGNRLKNTLEEVDNTLRKILGNKLVEADKNFIETSIFIIQQLLEVLIKGSHSTAQEQYLMGKKKTFVEQVLNFKGTRPEEVENLKKAFSKLIEPYKVSK